MPTKHWISMIGAALAIGPFSANAEHYAVTNLTKLAAAAGVDLTNPVGLSADGRVTGSAYLNAFEYHKGAVKVLSHGSDYFSVVGNAINDAGQIAGGYIDVNGSANSFDYAAVYENGGWKLLPGLDLGMATAINGQGQIAGYSEYIDAYGYVALGNAFLYRDGKTRDLGTVANGLDSAAQAINSKGEIVGVADITEADGNAVQHAFLYSDDKMRDLGTPAGYDSSQAFAVNDDGVIAGVGLNMLSATGGTQAFTYRDGKWRSLGSLPGFAYSDATGINSSGQVTGTASNDYDNACSCTPAHAFLYSDGHMKDLNSLITSKISAMYTLASAIAINDRGQILASGFAKNDSTQQTIAFLLTPQSDAPQ